VAHGGTEGRFQFITVNFDKKSIKKLASFMKCHYLCNRKVIFIKKICIQ
jgi:hypothetical protein